MMLLKQRLRFPPLVQQFENKEEIILRDHLALERTRLANERTLLSYIRTCLYLVLSAIAIFKLEEFKEMHWLGYLLFFIASLILTYAFVRFTLLKKTLSNYYRDK